jgi:hypothetical protein
MIRTLDNRTEQYWQGRKSSEFERKTNDSVLLLDFGDDANHGFKRELSNNRDA